MPEALTAVAAIFTIWAQSSVLSENGEFDRFKKEVPIHQEKQIERQRRQEDILTAAVARKEAILLANQRIISQTNLK